MFQDRLVLIGQKLVGNAKIEKLKCDILSNFQTLWQATYIFTQFFKLDKQFTQAKNLISLENFHIEVRM